jgi:hypothetical protein
MNQKNQKQITHWLKVAVIGITLGFAIQFVRAWTEPIAAPPGGNVGAPINTGATEQTKQGGLTVGGLMKAGNDIQISGKLTNENNFPAYFANVAYDDCGWYHPYLFCPSGYVPFGTWHTGRGICDSQLDGSGYDNGPIDSGWMTLCAAQ